MVVSDNTCSLVEVTLELSTYFIEENEPTSRTTRPGKADPDRLPEPNEPTHT